MVKKKSKLESQVSDGAFTYVHSEKSTYKICLGMLKKFWQDSKLVGKNPILVLSIPNDKSTNFVLKCTIELQKI